jgi:hypothetical protein
MDEWAGANNVPVLSLPTGQGLLIKAAAHAPVTSRLLGA